jgi:hypothetical protein
MHPLADPMPTILSHDLKPSRAGRLLDSMGDIT